MFNTLGPIYTVIVHLTRISILGIASTLTEAYELGVGVASSH